LRGGSKKDSEQDHGEEGHDHANETGIKNTNFPIPLWLIAAGGGSIATAIAFSASNLISTRRKRSQLATVNASGQESIIFETEAEYVDNYKQPSLSTVAVTVENEENSRHVD
jgi:cobalt-zinc-cadmium efflux system membrane fusion protein